jgi:hypothetical protein
MRRTVERMTSEGIGAFGDFREGGVEGVEDLRAATSDTSADALAFGRGPPDFLEEAEGYGASGARAIGIEDTGRTEEGARTYRFSPWRPFSR